MKRRMKYSEKVEYLSILGDGWLSYSNVSFPWLESSLLSAHKKKKILEGKEQKKNKKHSAPRRACKDPFDSDCSYTVLVEEPAKTLLTGLFLSIPIGWATLDIWRTRSSSG